MMDVSCVFGMYILVVFAALCSGQRDDCYNCNKTVIGNCSCYCNLENSLFSSDSNKVNLSSTFFPIEDNPPEFVTVTYNYRGSNTTRKWYWSSTAVYFLQTFEVFQYMSLFFGKPHSYYTQTLELTLAAECEHLDPDNMNMNILTQRLKLYAERTMSPNLVLSDAYTAKAYTKALLEKEIEATSKRIRHITIATAVLPTIFVIGVAIGIITICTCSKSKSVTKQEEERYINKICNNLQDEYQWIKNLDKKWPLFHSLVLVCVLINVYILCLAVSALHYWIKIDDTISDLFGIKEITIMNRVSIGMALAYDIVCTLYSFVAVVLSFIIECCICKAEAQVEKLKKSCEEAQPEEQKEQKKECEETQKSIDMRKHFQTSLLLGTILSSLLSICAHFSYIVLAYLNDAYHAGSIFIYYSLLAYSIFGLSLVGLWSYNKVSGAATNGNGPANVAATDGNGPATIAATNEESCCVTIFSKCGIQKGCIIGFLFAIILVLLGFFVTLTCYFVLIPINKSISDAPNRIIGIYESGGFILGSFIVYKVLTFFHQKKKQQQGTLKEAVKNREKPLLSEPKEWKNMSDSKKMEEFYSIVVDIIAHHNPGKENAQQPGNKKGNPDTSLNTQQPGDEQGNPNISLNTQQPGGTSS